MTATQDRADAEEEREDMQDDTKIAIRSLSKLYGRRTDDALEMLDDGHTKDEVLEETGVTVALHDITLDVPKGRLFVVMGLSGSGKSTLVRCVNRLIEPTSGRIEIDGTNVNDLDETGLRELRRDKLGMVFQNFGLFPHRTVLENVGYGLEVQGVEQEERRERAREIIDTVGLSGWEDARPASLSGGMQQRVGLARALAIDPDVLLMDEPFSALDPLVRREMHEELIDLQERLHKTILFITHDLDEAIKLGSRMAILRGGRLVQEGTPEAILRDPADDYVASFVEDVDRSRVLRARDVMTDPAGKVRVDHTPGVSLRLMDRDDMSSAFVLDQDGRVAGVLTPDLAVDAAEDDEIEQVGDAPLLPAATTRVDTPVNEVIDIAADEPYPVAVLDGDDRLVGIIRWVNIVRGLAGRDDAEPGDEAQEREPARTA